MSKLEQVREAIMEVFGEGIAVGILPTRALLEAFAHCEDHGCNLLDVPGVRDQVRERIAGDTYTGQDDPGGWAPDALAVIHCENGIDSGYYEPEVLDRWSLVSDRLDGAFCEHHNAAVICVWPT